MRLIAFLLLAAAQPPTSAPTLWRVVVTSDGAVVGRIGETRSADGRESMVEQSFIIQERGDSATAITHRTMTRRNAAGQVSEVVDERQMGRSVTTTEARFAARQATIVQRSPAGPPRRMTITLPPDIRFDNGMGLLPRWSPGTSELTFSTLSLDALAVERVVIAPASSSPADLPPSGRALIRRSYDGDALRGVQLVVLGADGRVVETRQPIFGTVMTIRAATRPKRPRRLRRTGPSSAPWSPHPSVSRHAR